MTNQTRTDDAYDAGPPEAAVHVARTGGGRLATVALAAATGFLLWQMTTRTLTDYIGRSYSQLALRMAPSDPGALLERADQLLNPPSPTPAVKDAIVPNFAPDGTRAAILTTPEPADGQRPLLGGASLDPAARDEIAALAERALRASPYSARAYRILGELSDRSGDRQKAKGLMQSALQLSRQETRAVTWLLLESLDDKDWAEAVQHADILLRSQPQLVEPMMPLMAQLSEVPEASVAMQAVLVTKPRWRHDFLMMLPASVANPRSPLALLKALNESPNPPLMQDLAAYTGFLMKKKLYELAYYAWLDLLPPTQLESIGYLFNGKFDHKLDGQPFNWDIPQNAGVTIEIVRMPQAEEQNALMVEFSQGRINFDGVQQSTMLGPGSYVFKGKYKSQFIGRRGLAWHVWCQGSDIGQIGAGTMVTAASADLTNFEFPIAVPSKGCRSQRVVLSFDARTASERMASGAVWYTDLRIERVPAEAAPEPEPAAKGASEEHPVSAQPVVIAPRAAKAAPKAGQPAAKN